MTHPPAIPQPLRMSADAGNVADCYSIIWHIEFIRFAATLEIFSGAGDVGERGHYMRLSNFHGE